MSCTHCEKSCLSFLPLRPSPVAKEDALAWRGSDNMTASAAAKAVCQGLELKHHHLALRLLRRGYLHIYMPQAAVGEAQWRVYHVDDEANLRLVGPAFKAPANDQKIPPCQTAGHDPYGQKLFTIPNASRMSTVWLAFSANLWSDKLKQQNAANPKAMVMFKPMAAGHNSFKPTHQALKSQVLECAMDALRLNGPQGQTLMAVEPSYPFATLLGAAKGQHHNPNDDSRVQRLAAALQKAAAASPKTAGKELAVVLPDPIALKRELSDLRLLKQRALQVLSPADALKLHSHYTLQGLADNIADARALANVVPLLSKAGFDAWQKHSPAAAKDAFWVPLDPQKFGAADPGRVWTPERTRLVEAQAPRFEGIARDQLHKGYDTQASAAWIDAHLQKVAAALKPYEQDWLQARQHASVGQYFALHFDETEANKPTPLPTHSAGEAYCSEAHDEPPPTSAADLNEQYLKEYQKDLSDPTAYVWRMYVGNQKELITVFKNLTGDPNSEVGMRDKTVDLLKGLVDKDVLGDKLATVLKGKFNHNWLSGKVLNFAHGQSLVLAQALAQVMTQAGPGATQAVGTALLHTAQYAKAWLAVLEQALNARLGLAVKRPMLVTGFVRADRVQRLAYGPQRRGSKPWSSKRQVQVTVLTDTDAVIAAKGRLQQLMAQAQPGQTLVAGAVATAALHKQHAGTPTALVGTPQTSTEILFADMAEKSKKLGTHHLAAGAGRELLRSTDGRLALAGVLVNAIGLMRGLAAEKAAAEQLRTTTDAEAREELEQKIRDAQLGWYDSLGGLTGASLDSVRIGAQFMQLRTLGSTATLSVTALQFGAALAGTFGGVLNAYVSFKKFTGAQQHRHTLAANLHLTATLAYVGMSAIGAVSTVAYGSNLLVMRGIGGQAVRTVATRTGAVAAAQVLGLSVPVIGWGLLGIGVGATVWAAVVDPSELEAWARQTPFGEGPEKDKFKSIETMHSGLQQALGRASEAGNESPASSSQKVSA
ncbi:T6SS effector BTH_I2691 family protein [Limnohabitans sp. DM1]|uniref:T6SS effector BTH_I2691 family protein n=1 Tax=Limnohabitans sp. DM1 TaxID=1597955 RepID=UPI000ABF18D8|nr:T6SS effector BTH_I2691 family protein [Limnohabitans sp. DM1]